jgi:hypothetical protein
MYTINDEHNQHSIDQLTNISSFANLTSSMLFLPKPSIPSTYINHETVAKVMQQQLFKKESLSDTTSMSSSSASSPLVHIRHRSHPSTLSSTTHQPTREDTSSSSDSTASSQRDSGLSSGNNDESSDGSPRDSLVEHDSTIIDSLIHRTQQMHSKSNRDQFTDGQVLFDISDCL